MSWDGPSQPMNSRSWYNWIDQNSLFFSRPIFKIHPISQTAKNNFINPRRRHGRSSLHPNFPQRSHVEKSESNMPPHQGPALISRSSPPSRTRQAETQSRKPQPLSLDYHMRKFDSGLQFYSQPYLAIASFGEWLAFSRFQEQELR